MRSFLSFLVGGLLGLLVSIVVFQSKTDEGASSRGAGARAAETGGLQSALQRLASGGPTTEQKEQLVQRVTMRVASQAEADRRMEDLIALAERDPELAIQLCGKTMAGEARLAAVGKLLELWAQRDPRAAWEWQKREDGVQWIHLPIVLESIARVSPAEAVAFAREHKLANPHSGFEVGVAVIMGIVHGGNYAEAKEAAVQLAAGDPELSAGLNAWVAAQWARFEPAAAGAWSKTLSTEAERNRAAGTVALMWANDDPKGAASFASSIDDKATRDTSMRAAVERWMQTDPHAAKEWAVRSQQNEAFDAALETIATEPNLMVREPAQAMDWASSILDAQARTRAISAVFLTWSSMDRAAAESYLQASPDLSPAEKARLVEQVVPLSK